MSADVYEHLAGHLDTLPAGFPRTASGVELRILRRLFTPEEAALAVHLSLLPEEPRVVARRAGLPVPEVAGRLATMEDKGLVYARHHAGRPPQYMATQFAVGFYEYQVGRLDPELVADVEEYLFQWFDPATWQRAPQLRTIPVAESVDARLEVLPYEQADALVRAHRAHAIAPCICRQEQRLAGHGCGKPLEGCLIMGQAAHFYVRNGRARAVALDEALGVLRQAEAAGLVLQPGNARQAMSICTCCGCCCGVLRALRQQPDPANLVASAFRAALDAGTCQGCGLCLERCQMDALRFDGSRVVLDPARCIGCGLCVTACPTASLRLERKPAGQQPYIPHNVVEGAIRLGRARGRMGLGEMAGMVVRSAVDRVLAPRPEPPGASSAEQDVP